MLRRITALSALAVALALPATAGAATEILYATTSANTLVSFTAQAPSALRSSEPIGGLSAGETIVGMDQRPATGQLYALTSSGRVLIVERSSGDTRAITPSPLTLVGTVFGVDFDPVADQLRIVSNQDQNLRVHPDTGLLVGIDGSLAYGAGDSNAGANPNVVAIGYDNGSFGNPPATTSAFGLDTGRDSLVKLDPAAAGTLATVGKLGVDATDPSSMAIGRGNVQYAVFATTGDSSMRLWKVASTGAATPAATNAALPVAGVTSLASVGETASDASAPFVAVGNFTTYRGVWLDRGMRFTITCLTECTTVATLRIGSTVAGTTSISTRGSGTRSPRITLNAAGRSAAYRSGRFDATLTFVNTDAAGNERTQVSRFTSLPGTNALG